MFRSHLLTACLLSLAAAGCSPSAPIDSAAVDTSADTTNAAVSTSEGQELNQTIQQPIDRAKAVEADLLKAQQADDEKLKEQGG